MPAIRCPIESCVYQTPDVDPVVAAALITTHASVHVVPHPVAPAAKVEKVKRPCISSAGTTEEWQYFQSRWSDYVRATNLSGVDKVIQLLECCDDQLRRDLTRNAGGTLTGQVRRRGTCGCEYPGSQGGERYGGQSGAPQYETRQR